MSAFDPLRTSRTTATLIKMGTVALAIALLLPARERGIVHIDAAELTERWLH